MARMHPAYIIFSVTRTCRDAPPSIRGFYFLRLNRDSYLFVGSVDGYYWQIWLDLYLLVMNIDERASDRPPWFDVRYFMSVRASPILICALSEINQRKESAREAHSKPPCWRPPTTFATRDRWWWCCRHNHTTTTTQQARRSTHLAAACCSRTAAPRVAVREGGGGGGGRRGSEQTN